MSHKGRKADACRDAKRTQRIGPHFLVGSEAQTVKIAVRFRWTGRINGAALAFAAGAPHVERRFRPDAIPVALTECPPRPTCDGFAAAAGGGIAISRLPHAYRAPSEVICSEELCPHVIEITGAPEEIRTPDPQIRSLVLYPAELRALRSVEEARNRVPRSDGGL
jgi:hypothetical protein